MKVLSIVVSALLLATTAMADRKSVECSDKKSLRAKKNFCREDEDCPQIRCLRDPCPAIVCRSGSCFADNILEETDEEPEPEAKDIDEPECKSRLQCPQPRCALGYPCPSFDCLEGQCVDVSEGAFAPCNSDKDCFHEGDGCNNGKCEKFGDEEEVNCPEDIQFCPDGSYVSRIGPDCKFELCPNCKENHHCPQPGCTPDAIFCPNNVCMDGHCVMEESPQCKEDVHCPQPGCAPDATFCPKNVCMGGHCVTEDRPPIICTTDVKECPDGSYVSRGGPDCEFAPCPPTLCARDVKECPDGTYVSPSGPNCEFAACPPYFKCNDTTDCPDVSCKPGEQCDTQYICNEERGICMEVEASCCQDPEPSAAECGRSGCHCCGDGTWLLGNSGPTLTSADACGKRGPSKPCDKQECRFDSDCPVLNCVRAPCPSMACVDNGCVIIDV